MSLYGLIEEKRKAKLRKERARAVKNVSIGTVLGITIGSIGGVLLAPKSGKETREDIKVAATDLNDTVRTKLTETKTTTINNLTEAKRKINEYLSSKDNIKDEAKQEFDELIQDIDVELEKERDEKIMDKEVEEI